MPNRKQVAHVEETKVDPEVRALDRMTRDAMASSAAQIETADGRVPGEVRARGQDHVAGEEPFTDEDMGTVQMLRDGEVTNVAKRDVLAHQRQGFVVLERGE